MFYEEVSNIDSTTESRDALPGSIGDFFRNRHVLITGGTGLLGKVLLEKLLRSCPDIGTVYLIIRPKKGKSVMQRLEGLLSQEVFNRLHEENPVARNKVVAIEGDLSDSKFSFEERDKHLLVNLISVVFHSAANVKFDEEMKSAVQTNLGGTKNMIELAKQMKNLKAFVHVSTAYSNSDRRIIEEKFYPPRAPNGFWKDLFKATEIMSEEDLNALTPILIGNLPNTYTFTKQITESMVYEHKDEIPIVIYRPSIVNVSFNEPYPGWTDTLNGPVGMMVAIYTGVLNVILSSEDTLQDYIGVDYTVNGMIAAAFKRSKQTEGNCPFYNCAIGELSPKICDLLSFAQHFSRKYPTEKTLWKPNASLTTSPLWFQMNMFFCRVLPAFFIDPLLKMKGFRFSAVKAYRKVVTLCKVLEFFTTTSFDMKNENYRQLYSDLNEEDKKIFKFSLDEVSQRTDELFEIAMLGVKKFVLKDDMSEESIEKTRKRTKYYDFADFVARVTFYFFLIILMVKFVSICYDFSY